MLLSMATIARCAPCLMIVFLLLFGDFSTFAANPYAPIVDRNVFGLKPPPPPAPETNQTVVTPPSKVVLTGITSMFGPQSKRAFFEITEQEPGKPAVTPKRPILAEGDREGDIEVLSIDIEQNVVRIRNRSIESELTFEVPKSGATTGAANIAANPPMINPPAAVVPGSGQPTIISSSEPRGGVTMYGGGGNPAGNSGGSVSTFGGAMPVASASVTPSAYNSSAYSGGGLPTIPNRTIRPPNPASTQNQSMDPDTQAILIEATRLKQQQTGKGPPIPPTQLTPLMEGSDPGSAGGYRRPTGGPPMPGGGPPSFR